MDAKPDYNGIKAKAARFLATGTYLGYSPFASGTAGTLWGIPVFYAMSTVALPFAVLIALLTIIISIPIASFVANTENRKDPGIIVCDEIAGFAVAAIAVPFTLTNVIMLFILFRFYDILKPFPAGLIDKKVPGGNGIVLDDVAAGIYANITAQLIMRYIL